MARAATGRRGTRIGAAASLACMARLLHMHCIRSPYPKMNFDVHKLREGVFLAVKLQS
jgi:hypothetical protein